MQRPWCDNVERLFPVLWFLPDTATASDVVESMRQALRAEIKFRDANSWLYDRARAQAMYEAYKAYKAQHNVPDLVP